jgi:parallel beta-helix repeat protein
MLKPSLNRSQFNLNFVKDEIIRIVVSLVFILLAYNQTGATNYYFSDSGNDQKNNGLSVNSPWESLEKLNSVMLRLQPGDSVLLCRGDVFSGEIRIIKSGTNQSGIYFGAYGKGRKPMLNGTTKVSGWKTAGQHKWEATCPECKDQLNSLFLDGVMKPIGRWPNQHAANGGYLPVKWASGSTRLSSRAIPDASVWKGADVIVRSQRWVLDCSTILSTSADTLNIQPIPQNIINPEFGFFICNSPMALDLPGEWCFDNATKKITIYSESDPNLSVVEVPTVGDLISIRKQGFITIENLVINGALNNGILADSVQNVTVRNIEAVHTGKNAVYFKDSRNLVFEANSISDANNEGLNFQKCRGSVIRHNQIKNIGLIAGMGRPSFDGSFSYSGLEISGSSNLVEYNKIDSIGYVGIRFEGDSTTVQYNVISNYCMVKDDGGGIYTWNGNHYFYPNVVPPNVGRKVIGNILRNGIGAGFGTDDSLSNSANGIYIDGGSCNVEVLGNTVYHCGAIGIFLNNASRITVLNNLVYNCKTQLQVRAEGMPLLTNRGHIIKNNTFVSSLSSQRIANFITDEGMDGIKRMGSMDSNYYCRPADPEMIMHCSYKKGDVGINKTCSLTEWKEQYGHDPNSLPGPIRFHFKINSLSSPQKMTYGFYHEGKDTWYDERSTGKEATIKAIADLTGGSQKGMNKFMILSMNIDFIKGEVRKYLLRFDTRCDKSGEIIKANFKTKDNQIVCSKEFHLLPTFHTNELLYIPTFANKPFERVNFEFSDLQSAVWIKNISFQKADVTIADPNDHFLFVVNDRKVPQTIPIGSGFVNLWGRKKKGSMVLKPFTSAILFKK